MTEDQIERLITAAEAVADGLKDINYTLERFMEKTLAHVGSRHDERQYAVRTLPITD